MKPFTITFTREGCHVTEQAKVYCDSLTGAITALMEWESDITIIDTKG